MKKYHRITIPIIICFILLLLSHAPGSAQSHDLEENPIRFAIFGDRTGGHIPGIYGQVAVEIERMRPDFVMTVGDMIEGVTNDTVEVIDSWKEYFALVEVVSSQIYYIPGNHDIWDDVSEDIYRRLVGEPHFSFNHDNLHFVILDNSRWNASSEMPDEQINWLKKDLEANRDAAYTLAFYHKPFWNEEIASGEPDPLHDIFKEYGVDAVFSGHYHEYFSGTYDDIIYTSLGSSGGATHPCASEMEFHFAWVTVDSEGIHIAPILMGAIMPWDETTADDKNAFDPIRFLGIVFENPLYVNDDMSIMAGDVSLTVNNAFSKNPLEDTLRWSIPEGWSVEPSFLAVNIPAGQAQTYQFHVDWSSGLHPLPSVETVFDYSERKSFAVCRDLWIARKAHCHPVTKNPKIDGKLNEEFWREPVELFFRPDGGEMDIDPVRFYYAYDSDNLYVAAYCEDNQENSPIANAGEHDGAVYAEDCVGFFFEPKAGSDTVYQIYVNPLATVFDMKITRYEDGWMNYDPDWNGEYEVKTVMKDDFWSMEARIPVEQFGLKIEKDKNWHLNFRRKQKALESAADWQVPIGADPKTMGVLVIQ